MFPPNPSPGEVYHARPGIFYTYDEALKSWILTSGTMPEPTSTEISNGLMQASDYVKLLNYPLDIKQTSIQGQDCQIEYASGNVSLTPGDSFLEIASTAQFPQQPLYPEVPLKVSNNTYAIDFSLNLPELAKELQSRGQYIFTGPSGTRGDQGVRGPRGYDNVPCGPAGQQGLSGSAPACTITSANEYLQATGATQRIITDVNVRQNIDNVTYDLLVTRELLSGSGNAAQYVSASNAASDWLVVTNNPNPGVSDLYYVDAGPIVSTVEEKFKSELTLLKNGYENVVEYWLKTMSVLYDEQRKALCCALERCISMTKNDGARQHMESVAANAAGVAKIRLNPRGTSDTITVGGDALKGYVGETVKCDPGDGFIGGGVTSNPIATSTTITTPAPTTSTQPPGGVVPGPGPGPNPFLPTTVTPGAPGAPVGGGGGGGGGNLPVVRNLCDVSKCNVSAFDTFQISMVLHKVPTGNVQFDRVPCPDTLLDRVNRISKATGGAFYPGATFGPSGNSVGIGADNLYCYKGIESWEGTECWNGQKIYPVGQNPFGFGIDGGTQGIVMKRYDRDFTYYVTWDDPKYYTVGKRFNLYIHAGVFCLTIQGNTELYLVFKVADRNGLGSYAEWAISLRDIENNPVNYITGGWGTAKYPGDAAGSTGFSLNLPFVPLVWEPSAQLKAKYPDDIKKLSEYRVSIDVTTGVSTVNTRSPAPRIPSYITAVGCRGTTNPGGLDGLTALTPLVYRELNSCLPLKPLDARSGALGIGGRNAGSRTYFLALRLKKARLLGASVSNGDYTIKLSTIFRNGYKVSIYSYAYNTNGEFTGLGGIIASYGNDETATYANNGDYTEDSFSVPLRTSQDYIITIMPKTFTTNNTVFSQSSLFYFAVFPPNTTIAIPCDDSVDEYCKGLDMFPGFTGSMQDLIFAPGDM